MAPTRAKVPTGTSLNIEKTMYKTGRYIDVKVVEIYHLPHLRHVRCTHGVLLSAVSWFLPGTEPSPACPLLADGSWREYSVVWPARLNCVISRLDINLPSLATQ